MSNVLKLSVVLLALTGFAATAAAQSHLMRLADVHERPDRLHLRGRPLAGAVGRGRRRPAHHDRPRSGQEIWAKFSPDGQPGSPSPPSTTAARRLPDGRPGGVPQRLTFHPAADRSWTGGRTARRALPLNRVVPHRGEEVYRISIDGGLPSAAARGPRPAWRASRRTAKLAYNRISRESRTWKRHQGGMAQDIWMGSLEKRRHRQDLTDWGPAPTTSPCGTRAIHLLQLRPRFGTLNLYRYHVPPARSRADALRDLRREVPLDRPGSIVYQYGEELHLLDLRRAQTHKVPVNVRSDLVRMRPSTGLRDVSPHRFVRPVADRRAPAD
jgi:tricorn protease